MQLKTDFDRLMLIFLIWNLAQAFGIYFLFPAFFASGLSTIEVLELVFLNYFLPLVFLVFFSRAYSSRISMPIGILLVSFAYFAFTLVGGVSGALLLFLIGAPSFFLFWSPFNTLWFGLKQKENAGHSTLYYSILTLVGVLSPALAGLVAQSYGLNTVFFLTSGLLVVCAAAAAKFAPQKQVSLDLRKSLVYISGFKTLFFLEGFFTIAPAALMVIISFQFFPKPFEFGIFMALATVVSILSSFVIAKISDRSGNRREFLVASAVALAVSTLFAASATSVFWWFVAMSLINFFKVIFYPFPVALVLDNKRSLPGSMYAREIMLNIGRSSAALVSLVAFYFSGDLHIPLAILGASMFVYAFVFEFSKRKKIALISS